MYEIVTLFTISLEQGRQHLRLFTKGFVCFGIHCYENVKIHSTWKLVGHKCVKCTVNSEQSTNKLSGWIKVLSAKMLTLPSKQLLGFESLTTVSMDRNGVNHLCHSGFTNAYNYYRKAYIDVECQIDKLPGRGKRCWTAIPNNPKSNEVSYNESKFLLICAKLPKSQSVCSGSFDTDHGSAYVRKFASR